MTTLVHAARRAALRPLLMAGVLLLGLATTASPCGGPLMYPIDAPLLARGYYESAILSPGGWPTFDETHPEILFVYPFRLAGVPGAQELWDLYYERRESGYWENEWAPAQFPLVDGRYQFERLVAAGDRDGAEREARRVIETVLDMSSWHADHQQDVLRKAVELVELRPFLNDVSPAVLAAFFGGDTANVDLPLVLEEAIEIRGLGRKDFRAFADSHPDGARTASLRYVVLQEILGYEIPNGWRSQIKRQMTAAKWQRLEALHDDWLAEFGDHPLADLVRLSKLRLYYFQGDGDRAWDLLLDFYPRRLSRVLHEIRLLVAYGGPDFTLDPSRLRLLEPYETGPVDAEVTRMDALLVTALAPSLTFDAEQWNELWILSEENIAEPWAVNLQERLLERSRSLVDPAPDEFPAEPANPTLLWGELRLLALFNSGQLAAAREQAASLEPSFGVSSMTSALHLFDEEWTEAALVDGLDEHTMQYLIRVVLPAPAVVALSTGSDPAARREAIRTLAVKEAAGGDWAAAADLLAEIDAVPAGLWRQASELAADTDLEARLAYARFMNAHHGELFFGIDTAWQRSLSYRLQIIEGDNPRYDEHLPWQPEQEAAAIREHLLSSSERYLALRAYADYLERVDAGNPEARQVLREADETYNWLINFEPGYGFWRAELESGEAADKIRRAGRRIRSTAGPVGRVPG